MSRYERKQNKSDLPVVEKVNRGVDLGEVRPVLWLVLPTPRRRVVKCLL